MLESATLTMDEKKKNHKADVQENEVICGLPLELTGGWGEPDDNFDELLDLMPFSEFGEPTA